MQTRSKFRLKQNPNPEEADFNKFERTMNLLLSQIQLIGDVEFNLTTDKNMNGSNSKSKN